MIYFTDFITLEKKYSRSLKLSGIYIIFNNINNKYYIGCSLDLYSREKSHLSNLKLQKHPNIHLQRAWNKYGEENFSFEILEYCDFLDITKREHFWVNKYNSNNGAYGYNIRNTNPEILGGKHSDETKLKISLKNKGRKRPTNVLIWGGRRHSLETIEKIRNAKLGKKTRPHTEETKEKMRISAKKRKEKKNG